MANADITAIVTGDTRLLDEALNRIVSKPRSLKLSVDNSASGALGRIRAELGEFSRSLAASNARVLAFGASAGAMYAVGRSIKELVNSTVQVEKRLTSINSILGASRSEFGRFGNELFRIAQETSSSFDDVADAAEELARQGVGIEETLKRTSSAMKLVRISGVSAVTAVEAMTAALNTNNDVLLTSESLINKLAAVDAKFAVSAAGLTEALKRVGSVAVDAGFSIDELIAAVTSAQQTTARGEAVIGNSLKTIFTRAQRPKVLEDFQSLGIETKNAAGNIRPLKDILIEVAKQYDNLSSAQQSNISELVGGVYQINILKALFRDLGKETSIFGRAFEESFGATDQASQRVAQLNETLDALFKRFSVNLTKFGSQSGNAAFAPLGKSLLKGMNTVLEGVTSQLGDKNDVVGRITEGLFKGLGNALSGPLLVGGLAVLIKLLRDWRVQGMDAIKTLSGLNRSFHNLELVSSSVGNFLREHPNHLLAISTASKTAEGSTRALAAATADYVKWATQKAEVDQLIGRTSGIVARGAVAQGVFSAPVAGRGETLQVRRASAGLLPEISEKIGAYAGGYKPGQVKDMNVPGMGRIYYNTAEKVKWFPGMAQPAIMPPKNSRAGQNYEKEFSERHGFDPYMANGLVPNFALTKKGNRYYGQYHSSHRSLYLDGLLNGKDFQVDTLRKSGKGGALDFFADRIKTDFSQLGVESVSFTPDNSDGRAHIRERAFNLFLKKNKIKQGLYRDIFSSGLIPNFSPLSSAIAREAGSVNSNLIRVGSHSALRGPGNPDGMGVYNLRDEPLGLGQGVERAKSMGLNPKTHGIPNFAFEKQKEWIFGNESSPGREGMFSKALAASFIPTAITSATGTSDSRGGKIATEITDALSLGLTIAAFARGKGGAKVAIGAGIITGLMGIIKQSTNSFNTLDAEVNDLKNKIQKAGDGMGMYGQTLEQLQNAYLDSSVSAIQIVKLQDKLAQTLAGLPEELRRQLMSAKTLEQVQDIGSRYSEARTSEFQQKELALTLSSNLNSRNFRRGSLIESSEKITEGMGKSKLEGVADIILSALVSSKGLEKIGGAAGLSSGDFFTKLKQGGISGSVTEQLSRVRGSELDVIKSRLIGQAGTRETDMAKIREMMPEKQRFSQQLAALEKQADAARKAIKQTFESIGQMANLRLKMGGRQGIMRATGINEEIQGLGSLMSETSSPDRMAITNYRSQLASNQLKAATETSEVFAELRSGISDLFNQFDLSRMGDIPANVRGGQSKLLSVLGGQNTVGGIGEGAISIFKTLGKDEGVNDIKKLMAESNEKLVDIQQTLREGNKIAEIQRNIAIQRAEFDRSLKTGGGLSSFLDRGDKYGKMSDIYGAQFGYQSGIFKGQGAIELVRSYLGAGGKATDSGVSGLLGTATEERALDIIETQKDLNRAFAGSGLKLGVPNISEARKLAETQIAAELKTGDSDMERQMAGLERALQSAISSSFGGQMSDAAQVFANVLAGSDTFRLLNSTLEKNTQVLAGLESSLKGMKSGLTTDIISSARAGGNIPMAAAGYEKMMAKAGGYNPGNVRRAGNLIYNSAERVDYLPGIREPIISPPPGSLAGFLHRQNLNAAFGYPDFISGVNPYLRKGADIAGDIAVGGIQRLGLGQKFEDFYKRRAIEQAIKHYRYGEFSHSPRKFPLSVEQMIKDIKIETLSRKASGYLSQGEAFYSPSTGKPGSSPSILIKNKAKIAAALNLGSATVHELTHAIDDKLGRLNDPNEIYKTKGTPFSRRGARASTGLIASGYQELGVSREQAEKLAKANYNSEIRAYSTQEKMANRPLSQKVKEIFTRPYIPQEPTGRELKMPRGSKASPIKSIPDIVGMQMSEPAFGTAGKYTGYRYTDTLGVKPGSSNFIGPVQPVSSVNMSAPGRNYGYVGPQQKARFLQDFSNLTKNISTSGFGKNILGAAKSGLKGLAGPASLALSLGDLGYDFLNPRMVDKAGGGKRLKLFGTDYSQVGEKYLGEQYGMIDNFENMSAFATPGKGSLYGTAFGMVTDPIALAKHFELRGNVFDLMESEGDVAVSQKRLALSQAKKLEARAKKGDKMAAAQLRMVRGDIAGDYNARKAGVMDILELNAKSSSTAFKPGITYQDVSSYSTDAKTHFQQEQFALTQGMSPAERVTYFKQQTTGKYGQWGSQEDYQAGLSRASTDVNRDTLAKRYNITAPGQLDRLHTGLTKAAELGKTKEYVAQLERLYRGVVQPAQKLATAKPEETAGGDKTKLDINVTMGGNLGIKNTSVEFSEEQYMVINSMIAAVSEGIEKKIKAITDKLPAETRSNVANATPPQAGPSRATPYGV